MTTIETLYGQRIRLRACGVLRIRERVLLLNHRLLNPENTFWNVPGGGLEPGEDVVRGLQREYREETHLEVTVHELLRIHEHIAGKLHAVELYFRVSASDPEPVLGSDPEGNILTELHWFTEDELVRIPAGQCPAFLKETVFPKKNKN